LDSFTFNFLDDGYSLPHNPENNRIICVNELLEH